MTLHTFQIRARLHDIPPRVVGARGRLGAKREIRDMRQTDALSPEFEASMVNAIALLHAASGGPTLAIYNLRFTDGSTPELRKTRDGQILNEKEILYLSSQILRDNIQGRLESSDGDFFVHFGWDSDIYCGTNSAIRSVIRSILESGLVVSEVSASPFYQGVDRSDWPGELRW